MKQKKNKGISLIVLIITIVVIIILAAAIILNLKDTNIIGNANEAVVKQDFKTFESELDLYIADKYVDEKGKLDVTTIDATTKEEVAKIIPSIKGSRYEEYVTIIDGKIVVSDDIDKQTKLWVSEVLNSVTLTPVIQVGTEVTSANSSVTGEEFAYNNPVIPVGFKALETTKATWKDNNSDGYPDGWNNGLVITDSNDNEYVWIPVDGTDVTYEKWNGFKNTDYTVTKEQVEDDTLPPGVTSETDQIDTYGGFYVARYEAGLPDEQTTEELMATKTFSSADNNKTTIGKAQSKANKIVWNRIDYNNAKIVSENVISTDYVQSGLITGTQWDTMLDFLSGEVEVGRVEGETCTSWGNYKNKYGYTVTGYYRNVYEDVVYTNGEYTKSANGHLLLQTGKFGSVVTEGSPKNLFDVAGNVWEWSAETVTEQGGQYTAVGYKLVRGGSFVNDSGYHVASYRGGDNSATNAYLNFGFRFVLYIK